MFLAIAQIFVAIILVALILLQERSSGLSGIFGGEGGGGVYQTRRGVEKFIFIGTIVLAAVFIGLSVFKLVL